MQNGLNGVAGVAEDSPEPIAPAMSVVAWRYAFDLLVWLLAARGVNSHEAAARLIEDSCPRFWRGYIQAVVRGDGNREETMSGRYGVDSQSVAALQATLKNLSRQIAALTQLSARVDALAGRVLWGMIADAQNKPKKRGTRRQ